MRPEAIATTPGRPMAREPERKTTDAADGRGSDRSSTEGVPIREIRVNRGEWFRGGLFVLPALLAVVAWFFTGCGGNRPVVVVYAAQDRVYAEPLLRGFGEQQGVDVRTVYDNEATKTTGLANRLLAEAARPQADLWWSNEELRTRLLVRSGHLGSDWIAFGRRERVLVVAAGTNGVPLPANPGLATLTNAAFRGRVAMAYPLFGTTATHLALLRERWGAAAWEAWCRALQANRPLLVDGNSVVVQRVARGDALVGLTDSDDVASAIREGLAVRAVALPPDDALVIPNTVAIVKGATHEDAARRVAAFVRSPAAMERMVQAGALDAGPGDGSTGVPTEAQWARTLDTFDASVRWLADTFQR